MFLVGGWKQTLINWDNAYPVLGISYGWLYGVALVFGAGMIVAIIANLWSAMRRPGGPALTQDLGDRIVEKMSDVAAADPRAAPIERTGSGKGDAP